MDLASAPAAVQRRDAAVLAAVRDAAAGAGGAAPQHVAALRLAQSQVFGGDLLW